MGRQESRPNPKETVKIIGTLMGRGFTDSEFHHHLGDSLAGFQRYCSTVDSFVFEGNNHKLACQLKKILDAY